jgi:DNA-directed RNA polymerase specialized sigma24 family protein
LRDPRRCTANAVAAEFAEAYQRLIEQLGDPVLQDIATWKVEGYTNEEIAARLGCATCTVERKLALIRSKLAGPMRNVSSTFWKRLAERGR